MNGTQQRDVREVLDVGKQLVQAGATWLVVESGDMPHSGIAAEYVKRLARQLEPHARRAARSLAGDSVIPGKHDPAARRRGVRKGKERGCWVYLPAELLLRAGVDPHDDPPYYRAWSGGRSGVVLRLYREG